MLRSLKYLFFVFFSLISLFISIIYLFFLIYKLNFKNKIVFLQPEGGFGHTISTPEVLNKLFRKDEWILIFGYNPSRHNYLIKDLYKNNFFWLQLTYSYNFPKIIFEPFKKFIFFLLSLYLNYKKIKYHYYPDYLKKFKDYEINRKMYNIHGKCIDCVVKIEVEIKRTGKWDEYEKQMLNKNKNAMVDDFELSIEEFYKMQVESYVTEQGDIESWNGGKINEEEIKNVKEYIKKLREHEL